MSQKPLQQKLEEHSKPLEVDTPIGNVEIPEEELKKKFGDYKIITIGIILLIILMIMILKNNIVISQTFQAMTVT